MIFKAKKVQNHEFQSQKKKKQEKKKRQKKKNKYNMFEWWIKKSQHLKNKFHRKSGQNPN